MTSPVFSLKEIAECLEADLQGDANFEIEGIAPLSSATAKQIAFLDNSRYINNLSSTQAGAVILQAEHAKNCPSHVLIVKDPYFAYSQVASLFSPKPISNAGIHPTAVVADDCDIAGSAQIGAFVVIESGTRIDENVIIAAHTTMGHSCVIGKDTVINPHVSIYHESQIGERVILHSGVVIGSDGFGFAPHNGAWHKIPQIGRVLIANDVEIGANTSVDRGALGDTTIGEGVKIDNLVQIAHNVKIGADTVIAGCVGIAGSTTIGKHCMIGGASNIGGHIELSDNVNLSGTSSVVKSITEPGIYASGFPAQKGIDWARLVVQFLQLTKLSQRVKQLEKVVKNSLTPTD